MVINWPESINIAGIPTMLWDSEKVMTATIDQKAARAHRYGMTRKVKLQAVGIKPFLQGIFNYIDEQNIQAEIDALRAELVCLCGCTPEAVTIRQELILEESPAIMLILGVATLYAYED